MPRETSLAQYIKEPPIVSLTPVGEMLGRESYVSTENGKFLIRSLLQEVHDCHQNEKCLPHFDASNVVVTDSGRAKLKGLQWITKKNEYVRQNYRDAGQILKEIVFQNNWNAVPEDMKHLIDLMLMMSYSVIEMEYVIRTHASLLPIGNRYQFFNQMHEKIKYMVSPTVQQHIMNALPYGYDWETRLEGNSLLEESFNFKTYDPRKGPMEFLNYYRNTEAHRMERYGKPFKYTPDEFEQILLVTFPLYLPIMQQELAKKNQLRGLKLHLLFPASK